MKKTFFLLLGWLTVPHVICYFFAKNKKIIDKDVVRWVLCSKQSNPLLGGAKYSVKFNVASSFYERIQKCVLSPYGKEEVVLKLPTSCVNTLHLDKV